MKTRDKNVKLKLEVKTKHKQVHSYFILGQQFFPRGHCFFSFYWFSVSPFCNAHLLLLLWVVWDQRYYQLLLSFTVTNDCTLSKHQLTGGLFWQPRSPKGLPRWLWSFLQGTWLKTCLSQGGKYVSFSSQVMFHVYNGLLIIVSWIKFSDYKDFCFYQ